MNNEIMDTIERVTAIVAITIVLVNALKLGYDHALLGGGMAILGGLGGYRLGQKFEFNKKA
jgi:hypothetical protein